MFDWLKKSKAATYDAGEQSRNRRDLRMFGRTAPRDEDRLVTNYSRQLARARCHDLRRNNPVVAGIGDRFADYVVHHGVRPQSQTSDEGWNKQADDWFNNWAQIADARERLTLDEICRLTVTSRLFDGECFHLLLDSGKIMPVESERCRQPKGEYSLPLGFDGIQLDKLGRVRKFCLHGRDRMGCFDGEHDFQWYDAQDVLHVARPWRFDSIRPMPELSPIANVIADMQELNNATLNTSKLQAMIGLIINKVGGAANPAFGFRTANGSTKLPGYPDLRRVDNLMVLEGEPGDTVQGLDLKTPGNNYTPFMKLQLQWIGACLGLPYEFVMMVFEGTSFSGSKALMMQAGRTVENWQFWLVDNFLQPLRTWRIAKAIKEGRLPPAPVDERGVSEWYKCTWQPPPMDWIDPQGQMQTDMQEYIIGATDLATIGRRRGKCYKQVAINKARELADLDAIAKHYGCKRDELSFFQIPGQTKGQPAEEKPAKPDKKEADDGEE
jgi:lambda family phage portal protein